LVIGLPSFISAAGHVPAWGRPCSMPSSVLRRCLTARRRSRRACGHRPSPPVPWVESPREPPDSPVALAPRSRARDVRACSGSSTPRGRAAARDLSHAGRPRMLRVFDSAGPGAGSLFIARRTAAHAQGLRLRGTGRRLAIYRRFPCSLPFDARGSAPRISVNFGAPWLACASPCQRFASCLAACHA
jgi:hypothetical protein